ncbi:NarK family nitrate/nitrite MFS transporter [Paenibacillus mucilaginosus]|uniref:Nitrate/nitrite transporter n=2 Tax=Paenibacillus mucilaginosus TaxID=61624 RepID=H6NJY4_9BACL|nr:NarK family nitrate/nitrite MFS transporter [Paenibacillus mucilaginosus]AEI43173.1 major facilitator superfamily MFS_1 [Paenibacillus mucilaginosus KNP414]AFC30837.1 major facilitator superfamily protein [Paenibacillus mucilaginosus 3016]MCG7212263.1 NarK family nitrate/nitrite MFS transporter [Paenibacillus mucilaginosus]WDM24774.1 NarK family nitrate/nitrite MFS transporter [Paenibacillus mucilaginosus]WFA19441.1 NarK family nitrate/nitrite MFS transporter [Paenibacillus mucilaginosus]
MARIQQWKPEDPEFWEKEGRRHAKRNLWISVPSLMLAFIVWQIWSVVAVRLNDIGFNFTPDQLFTLAAIPGLVGATLRFVYTFAVGKFGGRNWTVVSTAALAIPAVGIGFAVQNPDTPYSVMFTLAALCGLGGGNFSSSLANISFFFPKKEKGTALGINGGLGNMGVSVVQFVTPLIITTGTFAALAGDGQLLKNGQQLWLQNAAFIWVLPIAILTVAAWFGMDNLPGTKQSVAEQFVIVKRKHTWIMTWLYVATFGSFIGYSAAFPLLLKSQFPQYVSLAFLGAFVAAAARPFGGWISDKFGGARVTSLVLITMTIGAVMVIYFMGRHEFGGFLAAFLVLFFAAGTGSGSTFQMIPGIFPVKEAAPVLGFTAAFAAYGSFFIPKLFGWSTANFGSPVAAFYIFIGFYVVSIALNWYFYQRTAGGSLFAPAKKRAA